MKNALGDLLKSLPGSRHNDKSQERLGAALLFATEAHGEQQRPSGETYLDHGRNVLSALSELGVDDLDALTAALLHDVLLPHTAVTEATLTQQFGRDVTGLVKGVKALDDHAKRASRNKPAAELTLEVQHDRRTLEAIRRALLSIIEGDIRIILIRMADCLQDLRRASNMPSEMQREIAYEALHIYAPLANRLGIWQFKWQLEDLAFRYLEPEKYREIARYLDEKREVRALRIEKAATRLRQELRKQGLKAQVSGRPKHAYSIYRKMLRKELDFEQIYDIQALRVIVEPSPAIAHQALNSKVRKDTAPEEAYALLNSKARDDVDRAVCYQALSAVHNLWQPLRGEFDDYIGSPKSNGYRSLHTAVIDGETGQKLEVQIRTPRMHEEAERGVAAHWAYKEQGAEVSVSSQKRIQGLRELLATVKEAEDEPGGLSLPDFARLEERIHVFTPKGDVIDLPAGSTPIDFAYQIHTELGHRLQGARVNGKMVALDYRLKSGDKVEIIAPKPDSFKRSGPKRDWMNPTLGYTGSARTRSKIRQWFRQQEREQNIQQGRELIARELKRLALLEVFDVEDIAEALKFDDVDEFLCRVGFGDIQTVQITGAIAAMQQTLRAEDDELLPLLAPRQKGLTVRGVGGLHTRLAGCCHPIAPEPIIGYITRGQGVTIHRQDCKEVEAITDRERLIDVAWGVGAKTHPVPVMVTAYRRGGLIEDVVSTLRGQQISVPKTKLITDEKAMTMTIYLVAEVVDLEQLNWLLTKLANLPNVIEVRRQKWV
ncbi:bifunctional (p)ppGpp synthetase/guanosine-3',5'-bis(diphosphate) 3'-pyrophosphohydrolase [Promineifilum sp.]|uniref:RelA/SpoT family protein n=1 Tax=Promineifilum sp. TaxID=2664178 RepID=UPI0035AE03C0